MITATLSLIKKCVGFLFIQQNKKIIAIGTGFFVGVPSGYDTNISYMYFVTAKHVLQNKDGNFYEIFGIRLNKHSGNSDIIWVSKEQLQIFTHSNPDVDIAIFSCAPDEKIFDYTILGQDFFLNDEMMTANKIEEGTDILFTGLFTSHIGQKRNQPIVRFGKTALISDEKVEWKEEGKLPQMLELYLMECQSFGGNSGSPVFFKPDRLREIEKLKTVVSRKARLNTFYLFVFHF
ncbi:MAG: hypothetical protein IIA83_10335 [Thaumarchaeota archaeon]|nr:hypothetical protein [Nitrososphaerota archaeon]